MAKKYVIEPMLDIVSINKVIKIVDDDQDDDDVGEEGGLDLGSYCQDSLGRVWQLKADITELIVMFDMADSVRTKERIEARARYEAKEREAKKKRKREDA